MFRHFEQYLEEMSIPCHSLENPIRRKNSNFNAEIGDQNVCFLKSIKIENTRILIIFYCLQVVFEPCLVVFMAIFANSDSAASRAPRK